MKLQKFVFVTILSFSLHSLLADTVKVKATKEVYENVKTSTPTANYVLVESSDGTKQAFKKNAVEVTSLPVQWETPKEEEKPGFFSGLFASKEKTEGTNTADTNAPAEKVDPKAEEENKGFFAKRLPELTMGGMAILWILLP
ncbi:MAG: LIMLP_04285 family protein [Leptospira bouyouniensis]